MAQFEALSWQLPGRTSKTTVTICQNSPQWAQICCQLIIDIRFESCKLLYVVDCLHKLTVPKTGIHFNCPMSAAEGTDVVKVTNERHNFPYIHP
jgi:hypothetical protein